MPVTYRELVSEPDPGKNLDGSTNVVLEPDPLSRMAANEFYFDVEPSYEAPDEVVVVIVPRVYWDTEHLLWDQCSSSQIPILNLLPPYLDEVLEATWTTTVEAVQRVTGTGEFRDQASLMALVRADLALIGFIPHNILEVLADRDGPSTQAAETEFTDSFRLEWNQAWWEEHQHSPGPKSSKYWWDHINDDEDDDFAV